MYTTVKLGCCKNVQLQNVVSLTLTSFLYSLYYRHTDGSSDKHKFSSVIVRSTRKKPLTRSHGNHTHIHSTALWPGLPGWASTRKVKPIWILLKKETMSGSGIRWAICKSATRSRRQPSQHPTTKDFLLPAAQPKASKHWRHGSQFINYLTVNYLLLARTCLQCFDAVG